MTLLTPILAEYSPSFTPGELAAFLGILAFLLGLVVLSQKAFGHNPPLHKEYLSKSDFEAFRLETNAEFKRHAGRRAEIYRKQEDHGQTITRLESESERHTKDIAEAKLAIAEVDRRIDEVPQRTIEQLNEAKKFGRK